MPHLYCEMLWRKESADVVTVDVNVRWRRCVR